MHDDLIRRLRAMSAGLHDDMATGDEAADALEAMQAKNARWRELVIYLAGEAKAYPNRPLHNSSGVWAVVDALTATQSATE